MTTLPGTIDGLLRSGSIVLLLDSHDEEDQENPYAYGIVVDVHPDGELAIVAGDGAGQEYTSNLVLDLTNPTGFFHACLWLAEELELDASKGLIWDQNPDSIWTLRGANRQRNFHIVGGVAVQFQYDPLKIAKLESDKLTDAEALRLAVLSVAGVQP